MSDHIAEFLHYSQVDERRVSISVPDCYAVDEYIAFNFSDVLDFELDGNEIMSGADKGKIDLDSKPKFDAMRAELAALIGRIDAIQYVETTQ